MNLAFILLLVVSSQPSFGNVCTEEYNRLPVNADIAVTCGPSNIQLSIKVCPVYHANFDPYELALNGKHNNTACIGTLDNSNDTPLLNFTVLLDDSSSNVCGNMIEILNEVGTGTFSSYSNIETVVISGFIDSLPVSEMGLISYSTNLHYNFSCHYPLQYLLNNTEILTSFGSVAVNSNNGSFISTLRMEIFTDKSFSTASNLTVYGLKQAIYVQVSSNNSATSYNVFLDQCFATPSPLVSPAQNNSYNLFTACSATQNVSIISSGVGKVARFSFQSFRFLQHSGQPTSSIYLHCLTKLCQPDQCTQCTSSRRKRDVNADRTTGPDPVVVSFGPVYVTDKANQASSVSSGGTIQWSESHAGLVAFIIILIMGHSAATSSLKSF